MSPTPLPVTAMEQEDESISTLLAMGFPDILEIKRALRLAKVKITRIFFSLLINLFFARLE